VQYGVVCVDTMGTPSTPRTSVLQFVVAVRCGVLQVAALHCAVLQCGVICCSALQMQWELDQLRGFVCFSVLLQ